MSVEKLAAKSPFAKGREAAAITSENKRRALAAAYKAGFISRIKQVKKEDYERIKKLNYRKTFGSAGNASEFPG